MANNDDLMNNFNEESGNNLRKYLLIGGGLFVIFVIAIVASKFLFSAPKKENTTVILPPDIKQKNKDTNLFNDIPIQNDSDFKKPISDTTQEKPKQVVKQSQVEVKPAPIKETKSEKLTPQLEVKSNPVQKQVETKIVKPVEKKLKAKETKKAEPKPAKKVVRNYYIQVAAVTKTNPSKRFLKLITKNGFKYKILEVNIKGMKVKRVLVGPFSKNELKPALKKVKAKISASAFVKRIK